MNKIYKLILFLKLLIFKSYSKRIQLKLIDKHACMFLGLQRLAKKYQDEGDDIVSFDISTRSYEHLNLYSEYCSLLNIDGSVLLQQYS